MGGSFNAEVLFWLFVLFPLPIFLLSLIGSMGRLAFGVAGLLFAIAMKLAAASMGPDNPLVLLPVVGMVLALDAMVAELAFRIARWLRARRSGSAGGIGRG